MGYWGTGIYSNDIAEDVRDLCTEVFSLVSVEEGNRIIFKEFKDIVESDILDADSASFWYALSDWQWKHGILAEEIRIKAISLLKQHAGITDWIETGNSASVRKRTKVMDSLLQQLELPMPAQKLPKAKLAKPKHKVGDIIIFQSCCKCEDPENYMWHIDCIHHTFLFANGDSRDYGEKITPPFDAHGKYMAILCVGTKKTLHSEYVPELYDEHSIYAYYDFVSLTKPSLHDLKNCGFLPILICNWEYPTTKKIALLGWTYTFTVHDSFRVSQEVMTICDISRIHCKDEFNRFHELLQKKNYLCIADDCFGLYHAFSDCWTNKVHFERLGSSVDNLLDTTSKNPPLLSPHDAEIAYETWKNKIL